MTVLPPQFWIHILLWMPPPRFQDISSWYPIPTMSDLVSPLYPLSLSTTNPMSSLLPNPVRTRGTRLGSLPCRLLRLPHTPAFLHCICQAEPQPWLNPILHQLHVPKRLYTLKNNNTTIPIAFKFLPVDFKWAVSSCPASYYVSLVSISLTLLQLSFCKLPKPTPKLHAQLTLNRVYQITTLYFHFKIHKHICVSVYILYLHSCLKE